MLMYRPPFETVCTFCSRPFTHMMVNNMGDVTHCCFQASPLGNVLQQHVKDIWQSKQSREIRGLTKRGVLHNSCRNWGGCPFLNADLENKDFVSLKNFALPLSLELALPSNHCNINPPCIMCPRRSEQYQTRELAGDRTVEIAKAVRYLTPTLTHLSILGVAEPFWKNNLMEMLRILNFSKYQNQIHFWTFSNGTVFDHNKATEFLQQVKRSEIRFSVDAATRETYLKVRQHDLYDVVKKNIADYAKRIDKTKNKAVIQNTIFNINVNEMEQMVFEAKAMNVNKIVFSPIHTAGGCVKIDDLMDTVRYQRNCKRAIEVGEKIGIPVEIFNKL